MKARDDKRKSGWTNNIFRGFLIHLTLSLALPLVAVLGSAETFTLNLFGNADPDDTIDERDLSYIEGIISGKNMITDLSDANHDRMTDASDIDQVKKIIDDTEDNLTVIDGCGNITTFNKINKDMDVMKSEFLTFSYLLKKEDRAREVISDMDKVISLAKDRVAAIPEDKKLKGVSLYSVNPPKITTKGEKWVTAEIEDVAEEKFSTLGSGEVDIETIMKWDPDLVNIWYWSNSPQELYSSADWQEVRAVKEKKVYKDYYITSWSPEIALPVLDYSMKAYHDLYKDIDKIGGNL